MNENSSKKIAIRKLHEPCIGGLVGFSAVDWPDRLTATLFLSGCPWRCHYCHNPHLQARSRTLDWQDVLQFLDSRRGLLDGVVISGGEPLMDTALPTVVQEIRQRGFEVGLHTAGIYPDRLAQILPDLAWIGLDVKTLPEHYDDLTMRRGSWEPVQTCLQLLHDSGSDYECRTTWSASWLDESGLLRLARLLRSMHVSSYSLQRYREQPDKAPSGRLTAQTERLLTQMFPTFSIR